MDRIPVYLDSNVLIDMADGRDDELIGLILRSIYFGPYCYPFTAEQISEITQQEKHERNETRLIFLGGISRNIYFEHSIYQLGFRTESPKTVYGTINEVAIAENWEADFANFISYEQQLEARIEYGLSAENLNNLSSQEAIQTINSALAGYEYENDEIQIKPPRSLDEMLNYGENNMREHFSSLWQQMKADPEAQLRNGRIVSLFSLIDTFGFWSDSKTVYKKGSRLADSRHAFNGSYFNKVVSRDKRFLKKTEAAYYYFDFSTEVLHTEEFKKHLRGVLSGES